MNYNKNVFHPRKKVPNITKIKETSNFINTLTIACHVSHMFMSGEVKQSGKKGELVVLRK